MEKKWIFFLNKQVIILSVGPFWLPLTPFISKITTAKSNLVENAGRKFHIDTSPMIY